MPAMHGTYAASTTGPEPRSGTEQETPSLWVIIFLALGQDALIASVPGLTYRSLPTQNADSDERSQSQVQQQDVPDSRTRIR